MSIDPPWSIIIDTPTTQGKTDQPMEIAIEQPVLIVDGESSEN